MKEPGLRHALLVIGDDVLENAVADVLQGENWLLLREGREIREAISSGNPSATTDALVRAAGERSEGLDLVVWDAAELWGGSIEEIEPDEWMRIIRVDLDAPFLLARAAAPYLARSQGVLLFLLPDVTLTGWPWASAFVSATSGVLGLAKALASELSGEVRVNVLAAPPRSALPRPPSSAADDGVRWDLQLASVGLPGRVVGLELVAETVRFLVSPAGSPYSGQVFRLGEIGVTTDRA